MGATTKVEISDEKTARPPTFMERLEDLDDVQNVTQLRITADLMEAGGPGSSRRLRTPAPRG